MIIPANLLSPILYLLVFAGVAECETTVVYTAKTDNNNVIYQVNTESRVVDANSDQNTYQIRDDGSSTDSDVIYKIPSEGRVVDDDYNEGYTIVTIYRAKTPSPSSSPATVPTISPNPSLNFTFAPTIVPTKDSTATLTPAPSNLRTLASSSPSFRTEGDSVETTEPTTRTTAPSGGVTAAPSSRVTTAPSSRVTTAPSTPVKNFPTKVPIDNPTITTSPAPTPRKSPNSASPITQSSKDVGPLVSCGENQTNGTLISGRSHQVPVSYLYDIITIDTVTQSDINMVESALLSELKRLLLVCSNVRFLWEGQGKFSQRKMAQNQTLGDKRIIAISSDPEDKLNGKSCTIGQDQDYSCAAVSGQLTLFLDPNIASDDYETFNATVDSTQEAIFTIMSTGLLNNRTVNGNIIGVIYVKQKQESPVGTEPIAVETSKRFTSKQYALAFGLGFSLLILLCIVSFFAIKKRKIAADKRKESKSKSVRSGSAPPRSVANKLPFGMSSNVQGENISRQPKKVERHVQDVSGNESGRDQLDRAVDVESQIRGASQHFQDVSGQENSREPSQEYAESESQHDLQTEKSTERDTTQDNRPGP